MNDDDRRQRRKILMLAMFGLAFLGVEVSILMKWGSLLPAFINVPFVLIATLLILAIPVLLLSCVFVQIWMSKTVVKRAWLFFPVFALFGGFGVLTTYGFTLLIINMTIPWLLAMSAAATIAGMRWRRQT